MNGQWIGKYTGTQSGEVIVNMDDRGSYFQGVAYLIDSKGNVPRIGLALRTRNKDNDFNLRPDALWVIHPETGDAATWTDVKESYAAETVIPGSIDVTGHWDECCLELAWQTDVGMSGSCELPRSRADQPSNLKAFQMGWANFKQYVSDFAGKGHLF